MFRVRMRGIRTGLANSVQRKIGSDSGSDLQEPSHAKSERFTCIFLPRSWSRACIGLGPALSPVSLRRLG